MGKVRVLMTMAGTLAAIGCSSLTDPGSDLVDVTSSVVAIQSVGGGAQLDPAAGITITFDHPMVHADSMRVVLHEGDVAGAAVATAATWTSDRMKLMLSPAQPLKAATRYTVELRCAAMDGDSHDAHHSGASGISMGSMHGGSGTMMGNGMMGSGGHDMAHRMTFSFTTS